MDDSLNTPLKQCATCGRTFPATRDYFHKLMGSVGNLRPHCKECARVMNREYRKTHPPKRTPEEYKQCSVCGEIKSNTPENFAVHRATCQECVRKQQYQYHQTHKEEDREWRRNHPDSGKESRKRARRKYAEAHKDELRERRKVLYRQSIEKYKQHQVVYRQRHPERFRQTQRQSRSKYRQRINAHRRNYYAQKRHAQGKHTAEDIQLQYERQKGKCYYCGKKVGTQRHEYHVDHIVPLSKGGSNAPDNLVITCPFCNDSKGNKFLHEWQRGERLL